MFKMLFANSYFTTKIRPRIYFTVLFLYTYKALVPPPNVHGNGCTNPSRKIHDSEWGV